MQSNYSTATFHLFSKTAIVSLFVHYQRGHKDWSHLQFPPKSLSLALEKNKKHLKSVGLRKGIINNNIP